MACDVVDRAIQAFGAEGVSQDQDLAQTYAGLRTLRLADVSAYCVSQLYTEGPEFYLFLGP
jgi:alkylation response protein AidB-like acyl-CoA dehydrogenase